jgi:hypothetical protein
MRAELNARIGRSMPSPMYGELVAGHDRAMDDSGELVAQWREWHTRRPVLAPGVRDRSALSVPTRSALVAALALALAIVPIVLIASRTSR